MLLDMGQLLETPIAIGALIGLFSSVNADVLHQLVITRERLEALLALVGFEFASVDLTGMMLHCRLVHKYLQKSNTQKNSQSLVEVINIKLKKTTRQGPTSTTSKKKIWALIALYLPFANKMINQRWRPDAILNL